MKKLLLILFLSILVACSSDPKTGLVVSDTSTPTPEPEANVTVTEIIPPDPCENVKCGENERCVEGSCFCNSEFKQCNSVCIPIDTCCSDSDCGERNSCVDGSCARIVFCKINEKWASDQKKCVCASSANWCDAQKKCIPKGNCCDETNCNAPGTIESRCMPTISEADVCVQGILPAVEGKHCKKVKETARNTFSLAGFDYDVFIDGAYEDGEIDLRVVHKGKEDLLKKLMISTIKNTPYNVSINYTGIFSKGGKCENVD